MAPKDNNPFERGNTAEIEGMFGEQAGGPPPTEEQPQQALDEFSAASMSAPVFTAERPSHLGGPRERVTPAMPASVVMVGERKINPNAPDPRDPFAHLDLRINPAPSEEDRQRDARKAQEPKETPAGPALALAMLMVMSALLLMLVYMFGARVM